MFRSIICVPSNQIPLLKHCFLSLQVTEYTAYTGLLINARLQGINLCTKIGKKNITNIYILHT